MPRAFKSVVFGGLMIVVSMSPIIALGNAQTVSDQVAPFRAQRDELVAVVRDVTDEADCKIEVQSDDGPFRPEQCPPGSVISVERSRGSRLSSSESRAIVPLSGNRAEDDARIDAAVASMHEDGSGTVRAQATCRASSKTILGSYRISRNTTFRVQCTLYYRVDSDCTVRAISDKTRTNAAANGRAAWIQSCAASANRCTRRNIVLYASYTNRLNLAHLSSVGLSYRNESNNLHECDFRCTNHYGFWQFDD